MKNRAHLDTKELLLDSTQQFIQTESYDGFSFRELAERVGIRKPSIYHHFPSKEAIVVAMLERAHEGFVSWARAKASLPPTKKLEAYCFDLYLDRLGAGSKLCPAGAFASSWNHTPDSIKQVAQSLLSVQYEFLQAAIEDGVSDGSIQTDGQTCEDLAEWFAACVQGALVTARFNTATQKAGAASFTRICQMSLQKIRM